MGAREEGTQVLGHPLYAHRAAEKLPPACQPPAMSSDQEKKKKNQTPPTNTRQHIYTNLCGNYNTPVKSSSEEACKGRWPPWQVNNHCLAVLFFKLAERLRPCSHRDGENTSFKTKVAGVLAVFFQTPSS